ncbi:cell cycle checkpoint protein [Aspergillus coremiiformis]|uniref:Checkpoint protein n=1 Tax=Aspergillus coremiiformis TaxID=138285 RepID=A0A5N6ZFA4_9EURO|nr:cell cycle checkpoint protein [Aspergillus coremiiformis]
MRFRTQLSNAATFSKLTASLSSLGKVCWMRLEDGIVRFTIIPDQGTQVWAQLPVDAIFEESNYILEANAGVINLEVPVGALHRALRSAVAATSTQLRLTKKGNVPLLALTIHVSSWTTGSNALGMTDSDHAALARQATTTSRPGPISGPRERETVITQEIPVKVLHESAIEGLHEPRCRDPDVHIILPSLFQLKSISERFTKLATDAKGSATSAVVSPKLELSANMHGSLKLAIATDALRISSVWTDLVNPSLDPGQLSQTEIEQLPSERMRALSGDDEAGWAKVRIDGKDWGRVLSVGRLSPKVVACFIHETALILYVYLPGSSNGEDSCLTYYINSYAA